MTPVLTLICNPEDPLLTRERIAAIARLDEAIEPRMLATGIACDIFFPDATDAGAIATGIGTAIAGLPIDMALQDARNRKKKILVADMDSTIIRQECIDELAAEIGMKDKVAAITARAMNGEIEFEPALRERVALLKGLPTRVISSVIEKRIQLMPGAVELVRTMRAHGAYTALVSGGFTAFTGPVSARIGFHEHQANVLVEEADRLAGTVAEPVLGRQAKLQALLRIARRLGLSPRDALAVGDGANDLDMILAAGTGVALHAKPVVARQAPISIRHGDLTALLYLQGYRQSDIVS